MNMLLMYTVPGCPAARRVKQFLKEHSLPFEERNLYRTLLEQDTAQELLDHLHSMYKDEAYAYDVSSPSALPKPLIICSDESLKEHLEELRLRHCSAECSRWNICGRIFKGEEQ